MLSEKWLDWTEEIAFDKYEDSDNREYPDQGDLDILRRFLGDIGPFLNSLIKEQTNFIKLLNNDKELGLIQNAYSQTRSIMIDCLESKVWKQDFWKERGSYYSVFRSNLVRDAGLTGSNLRIKLHLLRKLWKKTVTYVKSTGQEVIDFLDSVQGKLLKKILSFLNKFLSSVAAAFPPVEAMKEFKDVFEGFVDVIKEPAN
jgi:hypothetical protein